jgi:hypothetical protein
MDEEELANRLLVARRRHGLIHGTEFSEYRALPSGSDELLLLMAEGPFDWRVVGTEVVASGQADGSLAFTVLVVVARSQSMERAIGQRLSALGIDPFGLDAEVEP